MKKINIIPFARKMLSASSLALIALTAIFAFQAPVEAGAYDKDLKNGIYHDHGPERDRNGLIIRPCGSHRHHHSHVWESERGRVFRCPGHD
jgi:hypothetical protein